MQQAICEAPKQRLQNVHLSALLWDLDGTLVDALPDIAWALGEALAQYGYGSVQAQVVQKWIGKGALVLCTRALSYLGLDTRDEQVAQRAKVLSERFTALQQQRYERGQSQSVVYPQVKEVLQALHQKTLPMALVTNKPLASARYALRRFELEGYFQTVVGGGCAPALKPAADPLLLACERLGVSPKDVALVGDSYNDVQAAKAAGALSILVPYGYKEGMSNEQMQAHVCVASIGELVDWF